jgi:CDGSH-type Zn-finger protein
VSTSVRVRVCPDGPVLVRGADTVLDEMGEQHAVTRPVVAVCACGRSSRKPWCDGTHQALAGRPGRDDDEPT